MRAGGVLALLVRIPIHSEVEEIRPDAAVVEQRVALAWRAVADDLLAGPFRLDEEAQDVALGGLHLLREGGIALERAETFGDLALPELDQPPGHGAARVLLVAAVDAERPAVSGQLFDVEERKSMRREDFLHGHQREIAEV